MAITLEVAQAQLALWIEAESKIAVNQSYRIGGKEYRRADLAQVLAQIKYWNQQVNKLTRRSKGKGKRRVMRITPLDL